MVRLSRHTHKPEHYTDPPPYVLNRRKRANARNKLKRKMEKEKNDR